MSPHTPRASRDGRFTPDDVRLGHVNGVFGLRGDVRLYLYNPGSELIGERIDAQLVAPDGSRRNVTVDVRSGSGRRILGIISGVDTPEAARALKDHELVVSQAALPDGDDGEWYHRDLLGTPVSTDTGEALGALADIVAGPGMDTWVVKGGGTEVWVHVRLDDLVEVVPGERIIVRDDAVLRLTDAT